MREEFSTQQNSTDELKLVSLNNARKRLGIRIGNLMKLIREKKIISKNIGSRLYVPLQSIINYVNSHDKEDLSIPQTIPERSIRVVSNESKSSSVYQIMKSRIKT